MDLIKNYSDYSIYLTLRIQIAHDLKGHYRCISKASKVKKHKHTHWSNSKSQILKRKTVFWRLDFLILATKEWREIQTYYFNHVKRSHNCKSRLWRCILLNQNVQTRSLTTRIPKFTLRKEGLFKDEEFILAFIEQYRSTQAWSWQNLLIGLTFRVEKNGQLGKKILFNVLGV